MKNKFDVVVVGNVGKASSSNLITPKQLEFYFRESRKNVINK